MKTNAGYQILQSVLFDDSSGFALGHRSAAVEPYAVWRTTYENGRLEYFWRHYFLTLEDALRDFSLRCQTQQEYGVKIVRRTGNPEQSAAKKTTNPGKAAR